MDEKEDVEFARNVLDLLNAIEDGRVDRAGVRRLRERLQEKLQPYLQESSPRPLKRFTVEADCHVIARLGYSVEAEDAEQAREMVENGGGTLLNPEDNPGECDDFDVRLVREDGTNNVWEF